MPRSTSVRPTVSARALAATSAARRWYSMSVRFACTSSTTPSCVAPMAPAGRLPFVDFLDVVVIDRSPNRDTGTNRSHIHIPLGQEGDAAGRPRLDGFDGL